jgi:rhamnopyranosyl-N-acetylglucosaminyl-diphospho-decaprenol beta-1,3/1,4-galactofuranosyltransferase
MKGQVCAATVAYNDPKELTRLLSSLTDQGRALRGLIVIDNSDYSYAAENRKVFDTHSKQYPFAHYHKTESNGGSAGGFRNGMKIAHENGFDWVWLLDQDGVASDLCLTEFLKRTDDGDILVPKKVDIDRPSVVFTHKRLKKNFFGHLHPVLLRPDTCQIDAFGTHGVLISKKVMDSIGYYDACNFFIGLEEYDYARRALQAKFVIIAVDAAEVRHPDLQRKKAMREALLRHRPRHESNPLLIDRLRPEHLGYVTNPSRGEHCCKKDRSIMTFSWFYWLTESLTSWQFAIAFAYSLFMLSIKFARENEICVKKTLDVYVKCLASNVRKEWPYGCVEEFCRRILE